MFINVMIDSLPAIFMLVFMTSMTAVLVASLMVFAETSVYSVDEFPEDYPYGVYIRPTVDGFASEPSPFRSIPYTCWWFFVTATTVGFGDDFPTTTLGRMVGMVAFYQGIVLLALPITIVGGNFNNYYHLWIEEFCSTPGDEKDEDSDEVSTQGDAEVWLVSQPTSTVSLTSVDSTASLTSDRCGKVQHSGKGEAATTTTTQHDGDMTLKLVSMNEEDDVSPVAMKGCLPPRWDLVDLAEKEVAGEQGASSPQPLRSFEDLPISPNVPDNIPTKDLDGTPLKRGPSAAWQSLETESFCS
jgi:hypothetical protein